MWPPCLVLLLLAAACSLSPGCPQPCADQVTCSQGLSCSIRDDSIFSHSRNLKVQALSADIVLCPGSSHLCGLCLKIHIQLLLHPDGVGLEEEVEGEEEEGEEEGSSGAAEQEEQRNLTASLIVCYHTAITMATCKRAELSFNHPHLSLQNLSQPHLTNVSMVMTDVGGASFSSRVFVYPIQLNNNNNNLTREAVAPSLKEVCSMKQGECITECQVPELRALTQREEVELQLGGPAHRPVSLCVQQETSGLCQSWNRSRIQVSSVTPCTCFQAWYHENSVRSRTCPFTDQDVFLRNLWQNVTVSVAQGEMGPRHQHSALLLWTLSAPCRLEGEVWPCRPGDGCRRGRGLGQRLSSGSWRQNKRLLWETTGRFEDVQLQGLPCVQVLVKGMKSKLGPFCARDTHRRRWTLLLVGLVLLLGFTLLLLLQNLVKKWAWRCRQQGLVKPGSRARVLLLGPPDDDPAVSRRVSGLGSDLCGQGFSVCVEPWNRTEISSQGPLLWFHSQLLHLLGGRDTLLLVLTRRALERAEEWTSLRREVDGTKAAKDGVPRTWSPHQDLFTASLSLVHAHKRLSGRSGARLVLVEFDLGLSSNGKLPELLRGLPRFRLPAETRELIAELSAGGVEPPSERGRWWKRGRAHGNPARTHTDGVERLRAEHCKFAGEEEHEDVV